MSYLIFIVAVGLFALLGAGGPLHGDRWFHALSRRVDAVKLDLWPSLALRVGAPLLSSLTPHPPATPVLSELYEAVKERDVKLLRT